MNEAKQIELLAKLAYRLILKVGGSKSDSLKNAIAKAMQSQEADISESRYQDIKKAEITLRLMTNSVFSTNKGDIDTAFADIQNKPALAPILIMADMFANAAHEVGLQKFKSFIPSQATETETIAALKAQQSDFSDFINALA